MKKSYVIGLFFVFLLAMSSLMLMAQNGVDDTGIDNDPATNPRANACYTGGSLAGQCNAEWKWVCGWGIIRVEEGLLNRANLATECQGLMPAPEPTYTPQANTKITSTPIPTPTSKPK